MTKNQAKISILDFDCAIDCIADAQYAELMETQVQPYLAARRETDYFQRGKGELLRFFKYTADKPRDTVVITHGFTETLEKYDETVYYLLKRGYDIFLCEHRGHGLSFRETEDYSLAHISRFDDYVEDFLSFVNEQVKPQARGRLFLIAHSMGGAVGVLAMEREQGIFDRAVMLAPMFGLNLPAPKPITYAFVRAMCAAGREKGYVIGQKPFSPVRDFKNSDCACEQRYDYRFDKYLKNPYMQGCAASCGWVRESIAASDALMKRQELSKIKTPILVFSGTADEVVTKSAHRRFVKEVETAKLVVVPKGRHELFTDTALRNGALWNRVFAFFEE